jgi:hypothetical protein
LGLATEGFLMEDPRRTALNLIEQDNWYALELWLKYWANGGQAQQSDSDVYLHKVHELSPLDLQILACALQEITT